MTGNSSICCVFRQTPRAEWLPVHPVRNHKRPEAEQSFRCPDQRKEHGTTTINPCLPRGKQELECGVTWKDNGKRWGEGIPWACISSGVSFQQMNVRESRNWRLKRPWGSQHSESGVGSLGLRSGVANIQSRVIQDGTGNKQIILLLEITRVRDVPTNSWSIN